VCKLEIKVDPEKPAKHTHVTEGQIRAALRKKCYDLAFLAKNPDYHKGILRLILIIL